MISLTDPARADGRRRLSQPAADRVATAWGDHHPRHQKRRDLL
ncbi:hypothetical protein [Actinomadura rubteroloni]|nr:hypothetical protein [Actinomadura rubteroloni]